MEIPLWKQDIFWHKSQSVVKMRFYPFYYQHCLMWDVGFENRFDAALDLSNIEILTNLEHQNTANSSSPAGSSFTKNLTV